MRSLHWCAVVICLGATSAATSGAAIPPGHGPYAEFSLPNIYVQLKGDETEEDFDQIARSGFDGVRIGLRWDLVEHGGSYDWRYLDRPLERAGRRGLRVLATIRAGNTAYTAKVNQFTASIGRVEELAAAPDAETSRTAFARFAAAAVARAHERAAKVPVDWEIWNEPDLSRFWPPSPDPEQLAALLLRTCPAMRESGARSILGPALGERRSLLDSGHFLSVLADRGALSCFNFLSIHPYWCRDPGCIIADLKRIRQLDALRTRQDGGLSIVISEWGVPRKNIPATEERRAQQMVLLALAAGVAEIPLVSFYEWRDSGTSSNDPQQTYGLVTQDRAPKPGLDALAALNILRREVVTSTVRTTDRGGLEVLLALREDVEKAAIALYRLLRISSDQLGDRACDAALDTAREELALGSDHMLLVVSLSPDAGACLRL